MILMLLCEIYSRCVERIRTSIFTGFIDWSRAIFIWECTSLKLFPRAKDKVFLGFGVFVCHCCASLHPGFLHPCMHFQWIHAHYFHTSLHVKAAGQQHFTSKPHNELPRYALQYRTGYCARCRRRRLDFADKPSEWIFFTTLVFYCTCSSRRWPDSVRSFLRSFKTRSYSVMMTGDLSFWFYTNASDKPLIICILHIVERPGSNWFLVRTSRCVMRKRSYVGCQGRCVCIWLRTSSLKYDVKTARKLSFIWFVLHISY